MTQNIGKPCRKCGFINSSSAKFCKKCGNVLEYFEDSLSISCVNCGKELSVNAKFCKFCGFQIGTKVAEEQARREAEEQARREAEEQARREAEEQARREAEEQARREAEERARREAEEQAREKDEKKKNTIIAKESPRKMNLIPIIVGIAGVLVIATAVVFVINSKKGSSHGSDVVVVEKAINETQAGDSLVAESTLKDVVVAEKAIDETQEGDSLATESTLKESFVEETEEETTEAEIEMDPVMAESKAEIESETTKIEPETIAKEPELEIWTEPAVTGRANDSGGTPIGQIENLKIQKSSSNGLKESVSVGFIQKIDLDNGYIRYYVGFSSTEPLYYSIFVPPNGDKFMKIGSVGVGENVISCDVPNDVYISVNELMFKLFSSEDSDDRCVFYWLKRPS